MSFSIGEVTKEAFWITPRMSIKNLFKLGGIPFLFLALAMISLIVFAAVTGVDLDHLEETRGNLGSAEYVFLFFLLMYGVSALVSVPVKFSRYILLQEKPKFLSLGGKYALQSFLIMVLGLAVFILMIVAGISLSEISESSPFISIALMTLGGLGWGWIFIRLSTLPAHISIGNGFCIKTAFSETKGLVWKILGTWLLYLFYNIVAYIVLSIIVMLSIFLIGLFTGIMACIVNGVSFSLSNFTQYDVETVGYLMSAGFIIFVYLYGVLMLEGIMYSLTPVLFKKIQESKLTA